MKTWKEFLNEGKHTYTVYKIGLNNKRSHKEHLNNIDELNTWLVNKHGKFANVLVINDATKKETFMTDTGREFEKVSALDEKKSDKLLGRTVIENGHDVGILVKIEDNPKGMGDVYHVIDADGDEWTFNHGQIKKLTGSAITVKT